MELWKKINEYSALSGIDRKLLGSSAVICAFSGGADSSVLLRYLKYRLDGTETRLVCAHVNHMIRGAEADRDENFCRCTAEALGVPFYSHRVNIPKIADERGMGIEECARNERYAFLSSLSVELGGASVATAHSATDNMETVVFNLCRGCGAKGVTGIDPVRGIYIRPLLCCTAEEIRAAAADGGINFVQDSTNADTEYTRNYVRSVIVPAMRRLNPRADSAVLRLSSAAREDCDYIEDAAREFVREREKIKKDDLAAVHSSLFARITALMWREATGSFTDISKANIDACRALVLSPVGYGRIDLSGGYSFYCHKDGVYISAPDSAEKPKSTAICVPGDTVFGKYIISVCRERQNVYNLSTEIALDFDKIYGKLYVRCREAGDTILSGKMHKKLKKLFCDKNVPQRDRDTFPVICDDHGIAFVPGVAVRDGVSAKDTSATAAYIYVREK